MKIVSIGQRAGQCQLADGLGGIFYRRGGAYVYPLCVSNVADSFEHYRWPGRAPGETSRLVFILGYVLGMAVTFASVGLLVGLFGAELNPTS